jgi:hypothetical protein
MSLKDYERSYHYMNFKKILLPFAAGALVLSLAACSEKEDTTKDKPTQEETKQAQDGAKTPTKEEQAAAKEMQAKLSKQQVDESKIVAVVNDEELAGADYNAALMSIQGQMQQAGQDPTSKEAAGQVKAQALDMIVNQTLILQKAKEADLSASEKEIDEKYAALEEQFGGEKGLKEAIKAQSMDIKALKKQIGESILFEKYIDKVVPAGEITEKEIQEYYDQVVAQSKESGQKVPPLEESSVEIKGILEEQQQQELLIAHIEELKPDAKIELKI